MARQEPAVVLAEIAWRWLFGGIATLLLGWTAIVFLRSVQITQADEFLLRTLNPAIIQYVLRELLHDKWGVLFRGAFAVGISLSLLWIVTATLARTATTRVLLERSDSERGDKHGYDANLRSVCAIQTLRVALVWIGVAAYILSAFAASQVTSAGEQTHSFANAVGFLMLFGFAASLLSIFNWILFLAPIFAVRDSCSFRVATVVAWRFSRARAGGLLGLNLAHAGVRLVWLVFMSGVVSVPFGFIRLLPKSLIFLAVALLSLVYLAVADVLFASRWAGFIELAKQESHPEPEPVLLPPPIEPLTQSDPASYGPSAPVSEPNPTG